MDIFEAEMARRFVVAIEKIANALDRKTEPIIDVYNGNADKENWQCITIKPINDDPQSEKRVGNKATLTINNGVAKVEPQTDLVNDSQVLAKDLVDDEFNPYDEECMRCKHLKLQCEFVPSYCKYELRDEPQTERSE